LSSVFLFGAEKYYKNITGEDWWAVYFENPKDNGLQFVIENKEEKKDFRWELWLGENKVQEGLESVAKDGKKTVEPNKNLSLAYKGKITLKVSSGEEKREIYKNLNF
jgi:hypothetical protein